MKLPRTEKYIKEGIKLYKLINSGSYGLFFYKYPTYDYKTVYSLEAAVKLNGEGWYIEDLQELTANLVLNLYRDLKNEEKEKGLI